MTQSNDIFQQSTGATAVPPDPKEAWRRRVATWLPIVLLIAFLLFMALLFGDRFIPAREVELVSVVTKRVNDTARVETSPEEPVGDPFTGSTLFQASGWIEPDPYLIRVSALYGGFIETVEVVDGESVVEGQILATMVDEDARLDLATAQAQLGVRQAALTEARAAVRLVEARLQTLDLEIGTANARLNELVDDETRLNSASRDMVAEREIVQSSLRVSTQRALIEALNSRRAEIDAELTSERAAVDRAASLLGAAEVERDRRQLDLDRTVIRSPMDAVIQQLFVTPGAKRFAMMDDKDSAVVAKLYQPDQLQARIDVPLEEAAQLALGQAVRLSCVLLQDAIFKGRVTSIGGEADLQRNTLQVKVDIIDPDARLRPEMLCRAEFLSTGGSGLGGGDPSGSRVAIYLPEAALVESGGESFVWLQDGSGERVIRRKLNQLGERRDGFVHVLDGLKPGDRVVMNPSADFAEGERIEAH